MSSRNVLFYSEYCFFSKDVLALITKKNMSAHFLLVCVDAYRNQLPAFVKSVPTILTHDRQVMEGATAHDFVDMMQPSCPSSGSDGNPLECSTSSSWSETYSFLEPTENTNESGVFSGIHEDMGIQCVPENNDRKGGGGNNNGGNGSGSGGGHREKPTPLSNYMANRDNDTQLLRAQQLGQAHGRR